MRIGAVPMPGTSQLTSKRVTAPYKYPREIHFVKELPKTVSGKIRRTELREWLRTRIRTAWSCLRSGT